MSKSLGGWIHNFAITETRTHKNGYTVYKITSIVFPSSVPEALTCITVWKRFHDIKRLYRELLKRHKSLQLRGQVPEMKDSFFKRFDPKVIQLRKEYILKLLDFAAQHPALYKSYPFLSFFENGHTPGNSPHHEKGNIEAICDNLDLAFDNAITLIDPRKDDEKVDSSAMIDTKDNSETKTTDKRDLTPQISFEGDECDYIYEAAYEFSKAVQAEVNQEYEEAFEKYKSGVEKLLTGSKDDTSEERKYIAKSKVEKYVARAEEIFEKYLLNKEETKKTLHLSLDESHSTPAAFLERPWNQLSKFKVMQIIDTVMQVQDITDKSVYIMKAIEKPSTNSSAHSIFLPQEVPYMVRLLGFFQSDSAIYLLLSQAKGGKLFDYIRTFTPTGNRAPLSDLFTDFDSSCNGSDRAPESASNSSLTNFDSGFIELCNEYRNGGEFNALAKDAPQTDQNDDGIPDEMNVSELVMNSQQLLKCVSNTLELSKRTKITDFTIDLTESNEAGSSADAVEDSSKEANFAQVDKKVILPEASVKQWARELLVAIESLHLKGVILGDLHPKNLLLGSKGQLLLSYFHQNEGSGSNLQLLIDTSALEGLYVAPERPLTVKSDCWSYGVILFELLTGCTFRSCHPAGLAAYFEVQYPEVEISEVAKSLLNAILQYSSEFRFDIEKIKGHAFFEGTNWETVEAIGVNSF